ncbi:hypothetical protein I317_02387 [Kwoniella heveanensis CBS 569]|uniref:Mitochondrial carrier protein n=1 Tax=Kwoniella heveanensis BCC8398 TaxID=1296120 RepID=A0A1B9GPX5_9TREE|nr:hypothetical protein I316_05194 [Kwoniella heveanensis BCC8398]OCF43783.1 hypothetical protein I317_02387 [Kwoniella heveanensis CBS 569]
MTSISIPIDHEPPSPSTTRSGDGVQAGAGGGPYNSKWSKVRQAVKTTAVIKKSNQDVTKADTLPVSSTGTSASAAFARSLVLFTGFLFRRPSKLFKPNRVDTWAGLRQLAISSDQTLSPTFIRTLLSRKTGMIAMALTIIPPLLVNTTMGFLLFTSHSFFSLSLARLPFFQHHRLPDDKDSSKEANDAEEEEISLDTLLRGPTVIPNHPTILSAIAGAGAGLVQGAAFTPVENVVRFLQQSTTSLTALAARFLHLPIQIHTIPQGFDPAQPATPIQAIKNLFASGTWKKSATWWNGWRWAVARDALSYSCFFAAFDVTRRVGLRVKALFGGSIQADWDNIFVLDFPDDESACSSPGGAGGKPSSGIVQSSDFGTGQASVPTIARVAQAATIVTGGVLASLLAEAAGRPFRACQRIMYIHSRAQEQALARLKQGTKPILVGGAEVPNLGKDWNPILRTFREKGWRPFLQPDKPPVNMGSTQPIEGMVKREPRLMRGLKRVGWRLAAVGPWGFGFLVWAWVGGEV